MTFFTKYGWVWVVGVKGLLLRDLACHCCARCTTSGRYLLITSNVIFVCDLCVAFVQTHIIGIDWDSWSCATDRSSYKRAFVWCYFCVSANNGRCASRSARLHVTVSGMTCLVTIMPVHVLALFVVNYVDSYLLVQVSTSQNSRCVWNLRFG